MPSQPVRTAVVVPSSAPSSSMLSKSSSSSSSTTTAASISTKSSSSSSSWLDRRSEAALGVAALAGDGYIPSGSKRKVDSFSSSSSLSVMERVPTISSSSSDSMLPSRSSSSASIATQSIAATSSAASSSNETDAELLRERFRYAAYLKWRQELVAAKRVAANNDHSNNASSINKNTSLEVKNS